MNFGEFPFHALRFIRAFKRKREPGFVIPGSL